MLYRNRDPLESPSPHFRLNLLTTLIISLSLVLILRLAYLQFNQYKHFATLSLKNQMSINPITPPRGIILDRNGMVVADNIPVYTLELSLEHRKNLPKILQDLQKLLPSITEDDIDTFYHTKRNSRSYESIPLKFHLSPEEVATIATEQYRLPGVHIKAQFMRSYPYGEVTAHLLGYVSRMNLDELKSVDSVNYRATNFIGKSGIEKYYENTLHGTVGYEQVETDASGRVQRRISKQAPVSGPKLYLTIDVELQRQVFLALEGKQGSAVVIDTTNGEILAMVSTPSYNPNDFVFGIPPKTYNTLLNSPDKPLYHRAVRGQYPPASTIKPFMALVGLESGQINKVSSIYDPGWYRLPNVRHVYHDWKKGGHGVVNVMRAITVSCDTFFYQLGNKVGVSKIEDLLQQFGFGQLTHIDLFEEAAGLLPSPRWKLHQKNTHWYPGDTLITSIGQGFMLVSPLQLANAVATISQHGRRFRPHLAYQWKLEKGENIPFKPIEEYPIHLHDAGYWNTVIEGMTAVIKSPEGTAYRTYGHTTPYTVAGKTGTAQVFSFKQYDKKDKMNIPPELRDNSLFIAFAPVEKPKIAIAVVLEHDHGAAPIARVIMDAYFKLYPQEQNI